MDAILHLGTEKTGTSTIQRFLKHNRESLMEQGFYFMKSTGEADDRKLSVYCLLEDQFDDFHRNNLIDTRKKKQAFERQLEKDIADELSVLPASVHTVIFSSEHLHSRVVTSEQREKLKALLFRYFANVKLLSYIRPQIEVAISHYSTYLKTQGFGPLDKYLLQCESSNYYYNYYRYLSGWSEDFPASDMAVRIFSREELFGSDVVADFCETVGLDKLPLREAPVANESVRPTGQELLKTLNRNFPVFIKNVGLNPARVALVRIISRLYAGPGQKPTAEQARTIQMQFDEINEKVRRRWFPERDNLFHINYEKFDQQEPVDWNVVQFFDAFVGEYSKLNNAQLVGVPSKNIDQLRDAAMAIESSDVNTALELMRTAALLRPDGDLIKKKIKEYSSSIQS